MKLPHLFHSAASEHVGNMGLYLYSECRCGARRTRNLTTNWAGIIEPGWPRDTDRYGRPIMDSGWRRP